METDRYAARPATDFGESETRFIWYPYIPAGDYCVLMADGGTGKTLLCCGLAASLSAGQRLPGAIEDNEPQTVLIISAEDRGELLKKRLAASGADLSMVYILDCMASEGLNFTSGYDTFLTVVMRYRPALVIVDPWHAFIGDNVDINRVNVVRPVFQRLANLAKLCDCGLILVSHVNKRAQGENANNAATGSSDFINAARSAMRVIFDEEPGQEQSRILVHTKSNYAQAGRSVKYRITPGGGVEWNGYSDVTRRTLEDAARWRKTPYEALQRQDVQATVDFALIAAIREYAERCPVGKPVHISYDQIRAEHGADIFGNQQPKRALDGIAKDLGLDGIIIQTGKTVKQDGRTKNGFSLYRQETPDELSDDLPE